jgi:hypothetical protein
MSKTVLTAADNPLRIANWSLMLLGIVCLGIGLWSATGAVVDLDFLNANHLNGWPLQVITEMCIAIVLMGFGPWCLLRGRRNPTIRHK